MIDNRMNVNRRASRGKICTVVAIDVSPSMECPDYPPTRLDAALDAARQMISEKRRSHPNDYMGIVTFGSRAEILCMPEMVGQNADRISKSLNDANVIGSTNIAAGLRKAMAALNGPLQGGLKSVSGARGLLSKILGVPKSEDRLRSGVKGHVVLLSDGVHNCLGDPVNAASDLKDQRVEIDCIGIGGSPSDVDEDLMKSIASLDRSGRPRYRFIGDRHSLITEFERLAGHICILDE